ncbi:MAG: InlB B-repeat-containing protein [Clostridia bacterium]|nr:InlB B-repeat-containing protein [Clostridia bacterium]
MSSYYGSGSYARLLRIKGYMPEQTFTVSFDANGGTGAPSSQTASDGSTITLSTTVPTRSGYTFLGWSTSSSATSTSYFPGSLYEVTGDTTLYAVWSNVTNWTSWSDWSTTSSSAKTYRQVEIKQQYGYYHYVLTWSDIVGAYPINNTTMMSNGYNSATEKYHEHWSDVKLSTDTTGRLVYQVNGESKLYDKYPNNCCTLSGAPTISSINHLYSMDTTRTLYRTRTAQYLVSYNANGGSGAPSAQTKVYGTNLTLSSTIPTREGYTFKGWATSASGSVAYAAGATYSANSAVTLYAVWEAKAPGKPELSISWDSYDSYGLVKIKWNEVSNVTEYLVDVYNLSSDSYLVSNGVVDLNCYYLDFYPKGSYKARVFAVNYIDDNEYKTASDWIYFDVEREITITYNANGGVGAPTKQTRETYNFAISTKSPTRTGYTFKGWSTSADGEVEYLGGENYYLTSSLVLYAVWQPNTYTVKYNANGGTGAPSAQTKVYGTNLNLSSTIPTRTGYSFKGWAESSDATAAQYQPGGYYYDESDVTLYAVWKSNYVDAQSLVFGEHKTTLEVGETDTVTVSVLPSDADWENMYFQSYDSDIVELTWIENENAFKVTALAPGSTEITVGLLNTSESSIEESYSVTVTNEEAEEDVKAFYTIGDASGRAGDMIEVAVSFKTEEAFKALGVAAISYDEDVLEFEGATISNDIRNVTMAQNFDQTNMTFVAAASEEIAGFDGELFVLKFSIKQNAAVGTYGISAQVNTTCGNISIKSWVDSGKVVVYEQITGDINLDDNVSSDDAIALLQNILFPALYPVEYAGSVDFNKDGSVNSDDAVRLLQFALFPTLYPID